MAIIDFYQINFEANYFQKSQNIQLYF